MLQEIACARGLQIQLSRTWPPFSYLTGRKGPSWIGMHKHNYCHLLNVSLPPGQQSLQPALCQEPPFFKAISRPNPTAPAAHQLVETDLRVAPTTEEGAKKELLDNFRIHLSTRAQDTSLAPIEEWLSQLARNLLKPMPLATVTEAACFPKDGLADGLGTELFPNEIAHL